MRRELFPAPGGPGGFTPAQPAGLREQRGCGPCGSDGTAGGPSGPGPLVPGGATQSSSWGAVEGVKGACATRIQGKRLRFPEIARQVPSFQPLCGAKHTDPLGAGTLGHSAAKATPRHLGSGWDQLRAADCPHLGPLRLWRALRFRSDCGGLCGTFCGRRLQGWGLGKAGQPLCSCGLFPFPRCTQAGRARRGASGGSWPLHKSRAGLGAMRRVTR